MGVGGGQGREEEGVNLRGEASSERRRLSTPCVSTPLALEEPHRDIISFGKQQVPRLHPPPFLADSSSERASREKQSLVPGRLRPQWHLPWLSMDLSIYEIQHVEKDTVLEHSLSGTVRGPGILTPELIGPTLRSGTL